MIDRIVEFINRMLNRGLQDRVPVILVNLPFQCKFSMISFISEFIFISQRL